MKYYMANTYQTGNIIVRAKNRTDVIEYLNSLDQSEFNVLHMQFTNQINNPPQLILVEKKG